MVLDYRMVIHHLHELHHAAVFVAEDVAVQDELAGEIDETAADPDVSRRRGGRIDRDRRPPPER